jgi:CTP:molybdopterin cytidylyltransferase MocA
MAARIAGHAQARVADIAATHHGGGEGQPLQLEQRIVQRQGRERLAADVVNAGGHHVVEDGGAPDRVAHQCQQGEDSFLRLFEGFEFRQQGVAHPRKPNMRW